MIICRVDKNKPVGSKETPSSMTNNFLARLPIILQIVPPAGDTFHLLVQIFLVLLQASHFLIGFVKGSFQLGVFFLQFSD